MGDVQSLGITRVGRGGEDWVGVDTISMGEGGIEIVAAGTVFCVSFFSGVTLSTFFCNFSINSTTPRCDSPNSRNRLRSGSNCGNSCSDVFSNRVSGPVKAAQSSLSSLSATGSRYV